MNLQDLLQMQNYRCCWCGQPATLQNSNKEHIIPRALGGRNTVMNYAAAHIACNTKRGWNLYQEPHSSFLFEHVRRRLKQYHEGIARQDIAKLGLSVPAVRWQSARA